MRSGGKWRAKGPASVQPVAETELDWGKQATGVGSSFQASSLGEDPLFWQSGVGPLPGRVTSHISHLIPQLRIFWLSLVVFVLLF